MIIMKYQVNMKLQKEVNLLKLGSVYMKSYQVVDFGKPLELREYENP